MLGAADEWARPLRAPARAAAAARLATAAGPTTEVLACGLHNRLFPACATPWAHCAEHRALWQLPPPEPIPAAPSAMADDGAARAGGTGVAEAAALPRTWLRRGEREPRGWEAAPPPPPLPPLHGLRSLAAGAIATER